MLRYMRIVMMVGVLLGLAGAAWAEDAKVAAGAKVYVDQKCGVCHSIAGKGNQKGALDHVGSKLTPAELGMWLTDAKGMTAKAHATRKPAMRDYKLTTDQLDTLVGYLQTLKKT